MTMPPDPTLGIICNRSAAPSVAVDNDLSCYWKACTQQFSTPELLYEHLCEWHVGRKTTNNLHLTCQWGLCRTATVRRDRMASHMLVHVPLRPHECKDCGKCFKRPQDLKKHVKSHADPMVLVQPPEEPLGGHNYRQLSRNGSATYHDQGNQVQIDDTASSYQAGQPSGYYAPQPSTSCGLYFIRSAVNNAHVGHSGYSAEAGRSDYMCTLGLIDNSFGDAKCRQIDASSHAQIDRFPMPLNGSFSSSNGPTAASDPNISQQADMTIVRGDPNQNRNSPKQQYYPPAAYMQEDLTRFE